jgi:hypothetical protein
MFSRGRPFPLWLTGFLAGQSAVFGKQRPFSPGPFVGVTTMALHRMVVKDGVLVNKVGLQLSKRGIRIPCRVKVSVYKGEVTLSGELQYEMQRKTALRAALEVPGVRGVKDELRVKPPTAAWKRT